VRALGAPRTHVLHARARAAAASPASPASSSPFPLPPGSAAKRQDSCQPPPLQFVAIPASSRRRQSFCQVGTAPTTLARQLPSGAVRAHPQARLDMPTMPQIAATSPASCCRRYCRCRHAYPLHRREPASLAYKLDPLELPVDSPQSRSLAKTPLAPIRSEEPLFPASGRTSAAPSLSNWSHQDPSVPPLSTSSSSPTPRSRSTPRTRSEVTVEGRTPDARSFAPPWRKGCSPPSSPAIPWPSRGWGPPS
jgi:hypothetical protein